MIRAAMTLTWIYLASLRTLWLGMILAKSSRWCWLTMACFRTRVPPWRNRGHQAFPKEIQSTIRKGIACWIAFKAAGTRGTGPRGHSTRQDNPRITQSCPCISMRTWWAFRQAVRQPPPSRQSTRVLKIMCTCSIINLEYGTYWLSNVESPLRRTVICIIMYDNFTG